MASPYEKRQAALRLAQSETGVTVDELCEEIKSDAVGAMTKFLNDMTRSDLLKKTEETRNERPVYRADKDIVLPPEEEKKPRKRRPKSTTKPKASSDSKTENGAQGTRAKSKPEKKEKAIDTALRLGARAQGFTLEDLAQARGSSRVGPFKRTVNSGVAEGKLRTEQRGDVTAYFATDAVQAPSQATKPKRPAVVSTKAAPASVVTAPAIQQQLADAEPDTLTSVAGILESFAAFLRQQAGS